MWPEDLQLAELQQVLPVAVDFLLDLFDHPLVAGLEAVSVLKRGAVEMVSLSAGAASSAAGVVTEPPAPPHPDSAAMVQAANRKTQINRFMAGYSVALALTGRIIMEFMYNSKYLY